MTEHSEKARFFAQYWGQHLHQLENSESLRMIDYEVFDYPVGANEHLRLTPLSMIRDEDAMAIIQLHGSLNTGDFGYLTEKSPVEKIVKFCTTLTLCRSDVADFLRSRGYALPYLGISVAEQVRKGWIKLYD